MRWLIIVAALSVEAAPVDWDARLHEARLSYSVETIEELIAQLTENDRSPGASFDSETVAEAYLIKAELLRYEFEQLPKDEGAKRTLLGNEIDKAAMTGMSTLEDLPESSEKRRQLADFRGTLIRSKFRAKKHRKKMEADAHRAVELDPENAHAYVSKSKLFLFADDRHGGDIERALDLLRHAQELDKSLETAQLLYAYALEEAGRVRDAHGVYTEALKQNPRCRPAQTALEKLQNEH